MRNFLMDIMTLLTQHPRYHPEDVELDHRLHWSNKLWISNIFRAYEWLFGRGVGIRVESSSGASIVKGKLIVTHHVYTLEAFLSYIESIIRFNIQIFFNSWISLITLQFEQVDYRPVIVSLGILGFIFNFEMSSRFLPLIGLPIAFDNHSSGDTGSGASSLTYSETISGSNLILWVGSELYQAGPDTTGDKVTGITYNSVSLTQVQKSLMAGGTYNRYAYLYMLVAPSTGSNNVVISCSDSTNRILGYSTSYSGAAQTGQPDASTTNTVGGTGQSSLATSLTTVKDKCWMVSTALAASATINSLTNGTIRDQAQFQGVIGDSNGVITPAGSYTMTWGTPSGSEFNVLQASFAPAPGADEELRDADAAVIAQARFYNKSTFSFMEKVKMRFNGLTLYFKYGKVELYAI